MKNFGLILGAGLVLLSASARADIDGKPVVTHTACDNAFSSIDTICKLMETYGGASLCKVTVNSCVKGTQEVFVGNQIELASPTNIKGWSGFGGMAIAYQAANLCLLRDLKDMPIESEAVATTFLGNVRIKQRVQFYRFDRQKLTWEGYHRGQACAPAVGCMDIFTQKITARALQTPVKGSGQMAGEYEILAAHSMDIEAEGVAQSLNVTIPAIEVKTPYGQISAKPAFDVSRAMGFVLAPYNGNLKSLSKGTWGDSKMVDLYGRSPGTKMTQVLPSYTVYGSTKVDNRTIGYKSQIAFGSRSADPKAAIWKPTAGEFPVRPDADFKTARSTAEKTPNAYLGAEVKVAYSPTELIPAVIRNNGFISLDFSVWAKPLIQTGFTSQFNFINYEIAQGTKLAAPAGPLDYRPMYMEQYKGFGFNAGTTAAARTALDAGVDLKINLSVPLPWPLDDINIDLIDIHPKTTLLEKITTGAGLGKRSASAKSQATKIAATGEWFQEYQSVTGPVTSGKKHIQACLAAPSVSQPLPPEPTYQPGNPEDLTKGILYPCNICVGMNDYTYEDEKHVKHTIPKFLETMFPASQTAKPVSARWACNLVAESGCYDMCSYNPSTDQLTVVRTAREMLAAGEAKNMPIRCN